MANTPSAVAAGLTGDDIIDATTHGFTWNLDVNRTLNWGTAAGFNGTLPTSTTITSIRMALDNYASYADIHFNFTGYFRDPSLAYAGGSDITITTTTLADTSLWAYGYFPDAANDADPALYNGAAGDLYVNTNSDAYHLPSYAPGGTGFFLLLHELGHIMGFKHPHDDGGTGHPLYSAVGMTAYDVSWGSVMSYNFNYNVSATSYAPATLMAIDVLALQYMYGVNNSTHAGNDSYTLPLKNSYSTIWDAGGTDTVNVSTSTVAWTIELPDVQLSTLVATLTGQAKPTGETGLSFPHNFYWLMGDIENVTGSRYNDDLTGNALNNRIDGGAGADTMEGGIGDDTYYVDNVGDTVTENLGEGADIVYASATFTLDANTEDLTLTGVARINGTGNAMDNILIGNSAVNILTGGDGNDTYYVSNADVIVENVGEGTDTVFSSWSYTLSDNIEDLTLTGIASLRGIGNALDNTLVGSSVGNMLDGGSGADTMIGGAGDDLYYVDNAGDVITENFNEGKDSVVSSVTYALAANIEKLTLTGVASIDATGNVLDNVLLGNSGNNTLDGDAGADTMTGGRGDDTYIVDNSGDKLSEMYNAGTDIVQSGVTWALGTNFEHLTLTGVANINGTGNTANNTITGNDGNNTLNGGGGVDTLIGGLGDDVYVVDSVTDTVTENPGEGTDTVQSGVTWTLAADFENLTLTGYLGTNGTGNAQDNVLFGNLSNNTLNGGAGADDMRGGLGNDTYIVDNVGDTVTENAYGGTDTVQSDVSFTLGSNIENLTLTGVGNIDGTGNALANTLIGNGGDNVLTGGAGADKLTGGAGADTFHFDITSVGSSDTIADFSTAQSDILDITDILVGFNAMTSLVTDFVQITTLGLSSIMKVDRDGTGGAYTMAQYATLSNVTGLTDEAALVIAGHIVV